MIATGVDVLFLLAEGVTKIVDVAKLHSQSRDRVLRKPLTVSSTKYPYSFQRWTYPEFLQENPSGRRRGDSLYRVFASKMYLVLAISNHR